MRGFDLDLAEHDLARRRRRDPEGVELSTQDLLEASSLLRAVLDAIAAGELVADSPRAVALVRRLEGAAKALEVAALGS